MTSPLSGTSFSGDVALDARRLLGCVVQTRSDGDLVAVRISEVEAYAGADDAASHAARGPTRRNSAMFGPPGTVYVYRSYGIHWCMNVVTGAEGEGGAVLLRGGEVLEGLETAKRRRGRTDHLADGPGKLCQALAVSGDEDGSVINQGPIELLARESEPPVIEATPRVGISKAVDRPWRFVVRDSPRP
ncbi:MAG: DNA-3-methyladenine glycosylase [Acidimicrobiia bacterium]|nr:DNA-3-methyladenine glycosylase [Acidimicrobiia bacterium]